MYAVPQRRAGETSRIDVSSLAPERDAGDTQREPGHTYDRASTPGQRPPPAITEQQPSASLAAEEYPIARPQQLTSVIGLVAAGLGLLAAGILGRQLMITTAEPAPGPGVAAAQPPAPIVERVPPPVLMSIAPEPPTAAPAPDAAVRVAATPAPPPIAAAALPRRAHAPAKPKPPVETTTPPASPATAELDALAVPAEIPAALEEPPEEAAPGTLRINSLPWAQVFLDGQLIGNTPLRGLRVPAGEHSLRFVNHQFAMVKTSEISVPAGEELTIVERLDE